MTTAPTADIAADAAKERAAVMAIICGDALTTLKEQPPESFDLAITSPPYNTQTDVGPDSRHIAYGDFNDNLPEEDYQQAQTAVLSEIYRVLEPGGSLFYNHMVRHRRGNFLSPLLWLMDSEFEIRNEIIWHKSKPTPNRGWRFWQADERIYWLWKNDGGGRKEMPVQFSKMGTVWTIPPAKFDGHPCVFPIEIPSLIISAVGGKRIIDPFAGSGTTLAAAQNAGVFALGIEQNPQYVEIARRRLKKAKPGLGL